MISLRRHSYPTLVFKDEPGTTDVHVDVPLGSTAKKKRKKTDAEPDDVAISVIKTDDEARIVYGVVLEPGVEDSQGDVISKADVEIAAHRFLYGQCPIGIQHGAMAPDTVRPVESYIAPADFEMGGQTVTKGSWVLATHVPDESLWAEVRKAGFGGYSIGGTGRRVPLKTEGTR